MPITRLESAAYLDFTKSLLELGVQKRMALIKQHIDNGPDQSEKIIRSAQMASRSDSAAGSLAKRLIDIIGSILGLIFLSPLLLGIAVCIKLENRKAPVIFKQTRVGKDERPFMMYKFRSMVPQAERQLAALLDKNEADGAMFKMKHDPRITRVGRIIRRTSLDELPQLWNVLKGDMSLVGPRPPLPREVSQYTRYHKQRLSVSPGCTGLWQVSGRSDVGFEEMVKLDLVYIRNRSIWLDFKIMIKTVKQMIFPKNAY